MHRRRLLLPFVLLLSAPPAVAAQTDADPSAPATPVAERAARRLIERAGGAMTEATARRYAVEILRNWLEAAAGEALSGPASVSIGEDAVLAVHALPTFYERNGFRPVWTERGLERPRALLRAVQAAEREGLRPADYHANQIQALLALVEAARDAREAPDPYVLVDLDLLLTDAFLLYGTHLRHGRVDPTTVDPEWRAVRDGVDMVALLEQALESGQVERTLAGLLPEHREYGLLRDALARYRAIQRAGGFPAVQGGTLRPGDSGEAVAALRARLAADWDLSPRSAGGDRFDDEVERAVRRFQDRHGLPVTGIVEIQTLAELSAPVERRIEQVALNMERWRWLPEELGERHLRVNIAGFGLTAHDGDRVELDMRAMVGHQYRKTPVFSDTVRYVVFAPYWNVPRTIAVQDIVPQAAEDPGYLVRNHIQVWRGWGANAERLDPLSVPWGSVDTTRFAYRFRQEPGATNPLGRVKFLFPNAHDVYVHDTPAREMFEEAERAFSSGCIRVEQPEQLARWLLRGVRGWNEQRIAAAMAGETEQTATVGDTVPIHILYWTAWVDEDGVIQFRNDIYRRDEALERALREAPPVALGAPAAAVGAS